MASVGPVRNAVRQRWSRPTSAATADQNSTDEEECCSGADVKKSSVAIVMLRWLAVYPAAFLGSAVIITVYDFLRPAVAAYGGVMLITDLLAVGGMGAYFVVAGAYVAPVKHIAVRATCASLYIAAVVYLVVVTSTSPDWVISPRWGGPIGWSTFRRPRPWLGR